MSEKYNNFYNTITANYNTLKENIEKKISINKDYEYVFNDNSNIVELYLNDKLKLKAEYSIIGLYNIPLSVWYWGWNIAFINKKLIKPVLQINEFGKEITNNYASFDKIEAEELYYIVSNNNFYISSNNIEKIIKLSLYLTKAIWCFPVKYNNHNKSDIGEMDKIEYILITKILQFN